MWIEYQSVDGDSDRFPELGEAFEKTHTNEVFVAKLGQADCRVIQMKPLVEFGTEWLKEHPVVDEEQ